MCKNVCKWVSKISEIKKKEFDKNMKDEIHPFPKKANCFR